MVVGMTRMLPSFPLLLSCCGGGMTQGRSLSCDGGMATLLSELLLLSRASLAGRLVTYST